jgi:hypothetical protein
MAKIFQAPPARQPRNIESDPAFKAATEAFDISRQHNENESTKQASPPQLSASEQKTPQTIDQESNTVGKDEQKTAQISEAAGGETSSTPRNSSLEIPISGLHASPMPSKMTIYPEDSTRQRLFRFRVEYKIAESIVAEYAIEQLFQSQSDEQIVATLRMRGHGLRRAKAV